MGVGRHLIGEMRDIGEHQRAGINHAHPAQDRRRAHRGRFIPGNRTAPEPDEENPDRGEKQGEEGHFFRHRPQHAVQDGRQTAELPAHQRQGRERDIRRGEMARHIPVPGEIKDQRRQNGQRAAHQRQAARLASRGRQQRRRRGDAQRQRDTVRLDADQGNEDQRQQAGILRPGAAGGEKAGEGQRHRDRRFAIARQVVARHEAGVERGREQHAQRRSAPGWNRAGIVLALRHQPRQQQSRGQLQRQVETDQGIGGKTGHRQRGDERRQLLVIGRAGQEGMRVGTPIRREKPVIDEIGGVGQKVEEGVGLARPRARHHGQERQGQQEDAPNAAPFAPGQSRARRDQSGQSQRRQDPARIA